MRRGLVGFVVLALALVASPARAESTYGSVTGVNGVLHNDCLNYPYLYSVAVPDSAGYRAISVTLVAPDGSHADTDYVVPASNTSSGMSTFVLCRPIHPYGVYTIRSTVEWGAGPEAIDESAQLADSQFSMRQPFTRTSVSASTHRPRYGELVTYRLKTFDERPSGYAPNAFAWVHLERKAHGQWVRMKSGRAMTHSTGRVKVRLRYLHHHKRMRIRAVTEPTVRYAASVSPTLRLW
jgi:hypothetical protein